MSSKIGILGGTFDPVHNGHLAIARAAVTQLILDRLLFVPNSRSPLKSSGPLAPFGDRLAMLRLATGDCPEFEVSDIEGIRGSTSYTVDTLRELSVLFPGAEFQLILGADALAEFHLWRETDSIRKMSTIAVVDRKGSRLGQALRTAIRIVMPRIDVSSTEIRERVHNGLPIESLVPAAVAEYIRIHRLYAS